MRWITKMRRKSPRAGYMGYDCFVKRYPGSHATLDVNGDAKMSYSGVSAGVEGQGVLSMGR